MIALCFWPGEVQGTQLLLNRFASICSQESEVTGQTGVLGLLIIIHKGNLEIKEFQYFKVINWSCL